MCRLQNIALHDYQESVTTGQMGTQTDGRTDRRTGGQTDAGQIDPYVPLCFAGDTKTAMTSRCLSNKGGCNDRLDCIMEYAFQKNLTTDLNCENHILVDVCL